MLHESCPVLAEITWDKLALSTGIQTIDTPEMALRFSRCLESHGEVQNLV